MAIYLYKGVNESGEIVSGARKLQTITEMKRYLEDRSVFEYEIYDTKTSYKSELYSLVSPYDLFIFCKEMSFLYSSNLTLTDGVHVIKNAVKNEELKLALEEICLYMDGGYSFSDAVSMYTHIFPEYMLSMIVLGEATSSLNDVFCELSEYFEREDEVKQKIKNALKYPAILTGMVSLLSLFAVTLVFPYFERAIGDLDIVTHRFQIYTIFRIIIPIILILDILLYVFLKLYKKTENGKILVGKLKIKVPILKNIYLKTTLSKICKTLHILIKNGVYVSDAFPQIINSVDNEYIKQEMMSINEKIADGQNFIEAIEESNILPEEFTKKLAIGNATGQLDEVLLLLSKTFTNDVNSEIERINKVYEPIITATVAIIAGIIVISTILPVINLLRTISF
ncbi:MAG: type II secretion system F family protein [Defluviitaleaceae bacterium]|nr:type II secretion system F family protein [Defluviitaleaceae bacterium]